MEFNQVVFPVPSSSYTKSTFPSQLIWIPVNPPIPCLFLSYQCGSSKLLLFFHANAQDLGYTWKLAHHLKNSLQIHVLVIEYPGYGLYRGTPSAQRIQEDAIKIYNFLITQKNWDEKNIIIVGRSIGTGPATYVASSMNPGALILISPYISLKAIIGGFAGGLMSWVSCLFKDRFKNLRVIREVTCPTLILHGEDDRLIPYSHSQALYEACGGPCTFLVPRGMDHDNFEFQEHLSEPILDFFENCGISVLFQSVHTAFLDFTTKNWK